MQRLIVRPWAALVWACLQIASCTNSVPDDATHDTGDEDVGDSDVPDAAGGLTSRQAEAVVMRGAELPSALRGGSPADIVAFVRHGDAWQLVPVQVDERDRIDFCQVYAKTLFSPELSPCGTTSVIEFLAYSDPNTYAGADTDSTFDGDDELAFMARDAGDRTTAADPPGVVAGSRVELTLTADGETGFVYLFLRSDASLPAAADYVSYRLSFDPQVNYLTDYPFRGDGSCGGTICDPPILEDSAITTEHYSRHFSARWLTDELRIFGPASTGENILDVAQSRFGPDLCGRHVLTFSTAEGAFVSNIDGPVRAIRSYLGANSGPITQRTHLFYDRMEVVTTALRVHAIQGIMELVDYASTAAGMTYVNSANRVGLAIDGVPDTGFDPALPAWERVTGPHGSLTRILSVDTSLTLSIRGYYEDDADTPNNQCSASTTVDHPDDIAFGTSGVFIDAQIPDTDPRHGSLDHLQLVAKHYYDDTARSVDDIDALAVAPAILVTSVPSIAPLPARGCGDGYCSDVETSVSCAADCSTQATGGSVCGNATCEADEHELSCVQDCWDASYEPLVACLQNKCSELHGACSDEAPCVDLVVCAFACLASGSGTGECQASCGASIEATAEQQQVALAAVACGLANCE